MISCLLGYLIIGIPLGIVIGGAIGCLARRYEAR